MVALDGHSRPNMDRHTRQATGGLLGRGEGTRQFAQSPIPVLSTDRDLQRRD
jgi:hypothetical protein